jgi:hypothetical protein
MPRHLTEVVDIRGGGQLLAQRAAGDRSLPVENMTSRLAIYECWARQVLEIRNPAPAYLRER